MNPNQSFPVKSLVMTGLFAALLAVLSPLSIPMPSGVPITLQTFAVALTGAVLGVRLGSIATTVYLLIGAVGLPVFSNFGSGFQVLLGPTGGFLFGFVGMAALCGLGTSRPTRREDADFKARAKWREWLPAPRAALFGVCGLLVCHALGCIQYAAVTGTPFLSAILLVSVPFLLKDVVSIALAFLIGSRVRVGLRMRTA